MAYEGLRSFFCETPALGADKIQFGRSIIGVMDAMEDIGQELTFYEPRPADGRGGSISSKSWAARGCTWKSDSISLRS